ncbi:MAG TPA: hypothetical protein VF618_16100 [Thermoanaerobaculia bacterium]
MSYYTRIEHSLEQGAFVRSTTGPRLKVILHQTSDNHLRSISEPVCQSDDDLTLPVIVSDHAAQVWRDRVRSDASSSAGRRNRIEDFALGAPFDEPELETFARELQQLWRFWFSEQDGRWVPRRYRSPETLFAVVREVLRDNYVSLFLQNVGVEEDSQHIRPNPEIRMGVRHAQATFSFSWPMTYASYRELEEATQSESRSDVTLHQLLPKRTGVGWAAARAIRPKILVIDDEAAKVADILRRTPVSPEESGLCLGDLCDFIPAPKTPPQTFDDVKRGLNRFLSRQTDHGFCELPEVRAADFVLLDLSMKQAPDEELGGFDVLRTLRGECPDVPVIIHSSFTDYRNVIRAVQNGATWFSAKRHENPESAATRMPIVSTPLLAVLEDVERQHGWAEEHVRIKREVDYAGQPRPGEGTARQSLYEYFWSRLAAELPAGPDTKLRVSTLGAGIGGAVTRKVVVASTAQQESGRKNIDAGAFVAKIDRTDRMIAEKERYRRFVYPYLGSRAGRVDSDVISADGVSAIAYAFSGTPQHGEAASRHYETVTLDKLFLANLSSPHPEPFAAYEPLLDELFQLLAVLHGVRQPHRKLWADHFFSETRSLRESFSVRLPVDFVIEVEELLEPEFKEGERQTVAPTDDGRIHIPNAWIEDVGDDQIGIAGYGKDGLFRAKLEGPTVQFLLRGERRRLTVFRRLGVRGKVRAERADLLKALVADPDIGERRQPLLKKYDLETSDPIRNTRLLKQVFDVFDVIGGNAQTPRADRERIGIVHGDLNMGNILVERVGTSIPGPGALWLIDFAASRRDSIAHDFIELEADVLTLLKEEYLSGADVDLVEFIKSLDTTALAYPEKVMKSAQLRFLFDAVQSIRRAAGRAGVSRFEYLAGLLAYDLVILKIADRKAAAMAGSAKQSSLMKRVAATAAAVCTRELEETRIRVSCSTVHRITDGNRYLLRVSGRTREQDVFSLKPIGGYLQISSDNRDPVTAWIPTQEIGILELNTFLGSRFETFWAERYEPARAVERLRAELLPLLKRDARELVEELRLGAAPRYRYVIGESSTRNVDQRARLIAMPQTLWCMQVHDVQVSPDALTRLCTGAAVADTRAGGKKPRWLEVVTPAEIRALAKGSQSIAPMCLGLLE